MNRRPGEPEACSGPGATGEDACDAVGFTVVEQLEPATPAEAVEQIAGAGPEAAGRGTDLAEHGDSQQPPGPQSGHECLVEVWGVEEMADHDIDRRARRHSRVEVGELDPAAIGHPRAIREVTGEGHRGRCHVDGEHVEAAAGEPHRSPSVAARQVERDAVDRERIGEVDEGRRWADGLDRNRAGRGIALVPSGPVVVAHAITVRVIMRGPRLTGN